MEYWDAEVLPGVPFNSQPKEGYLLHITKAMLLEKYKGDDPVCLFLSVDGQKHVLGRLSSDKFPQTTYNLIFDKPFELSHSGNDESVYFSGYESKSDDRALSEEPLEDSNDESEDDGSKDCTGGKEVMITIRKTAHGSTIILLNNDSGIFTMADGYAHEEYSDVDEDETDPDKLEYLANEDEQKTCILGERMLVSSAGQSAYDENIIDHLDLVIANPQWNSQRCANFAHYCLEKNLVSPFHGQLTPQQQEIGCEMTFGAYENNESSVYYASRDEIKKIVRDSEYKGEDKWSSVGCVGYRTLGTGAAYVDPFYLRQQETDIGSSDIRKNVLFLLKGMKEALPDKNTGGIMTIHHINETGIRVVPPFHARDISSYIKELQQ